MAPQAGPGPCWALAVLLSSSIIALTTLDMCLAHWGHGWELSCSLRRQRHKSCPTAMSLVLPKAAPQCGEDQGSLSSEVGCLCWPRSGAPVAPLGAQAEALGPGWGPGLCGFGRTLLS